MQDTIAYYRVSTNKQSYSGLGLEAQRRAVNDFARFNNYRVIAEYTEVESGKHNDRAILQNALKACKQKEAVLLIAKLDRLSRNVYFISKLIESGVDFKAVDNPYATKLMIQVIAAFSEYERDQNSIRTKAALAEARKRGVVLGVYGRDVLSKRNSERALAFALATAPIIEQIRKNGTRTIRGITAELNRLEIPTYRNNGGKWHPTTVQNLVRRLNKHYQNNRYDKDIDDSTNGIRAVLHCKQSNISK